MWIVPIWVCVIILLLVDFQYFYLYPDENKDSSTEKMKECQKAKRSTFNIKHALNLICTYLTSKKLLQLLIEVGTVTLGALLAIYLTNMADENDHRRDLLTLLSHVGSDMAVQADVLDKNLLKYQNNEIDIEDLRLNALIDVALVEDVIHEVYVMETLRDGPYSLMLNLYREIVQINTFLSSDREATDEYVVSLCKKLSANALLISNMVEHTLAYVKDKLSIEEYTQRYQDLVMSLYKSKPEAIFSTSE